MEGRPRLHMLWFSLKTSPEGTSFVNLKKVIAESYHEDPETFSKEIYALEKLRNQAMNTKKDGSEVMKRYYCQLHFLVSRFPQLSQRGCFKFKWREIYSSSVIEVTDLRYEMAAVLFNIAASHSQSGASANRTESDGIKLACTHFQCAAWAFGELREQFADVNNAEDFMTPETLQFMQQICFAQAQECILEKSLIDNRKPNIVAKVTAQIIEYYSTALMIILDGGYNGPVAVFTELSMYKLWKNYVSFKISYLRCILYMYQGLHAEEQKKMGERVVLLNAAWDSLEQARKEARGLFDHKEMEEALVFTADVVGAKRKNAVNENEFIYHETVPELTSISAVQGANLVKGISFSVTDPEVAGEDIFARLVPMGAHEASSLYSEEKAKLLRKYNQIIEDKDNELVNYMNSLSLENLNINEEKANKLPQGIVDRCAALSANKDAIPNLIDAMSQLATITGEVEANLEDLAELLASEEREENEFQAKTGVQRTQNTHLTELVREFQKYSEAHTRAGESNNTLSKAMNLHVNNLKILGRPLREIQQAMPKLGSELNTADIFKDVKLIVNKVNEMKAQRAQFHADFRIALSEDDITSKLIAHGSNEGLDSLFAQELGKHERLTQLIEQNLLAQENILHALTESYAKAAPVLKVLSEVKQKQENFFSALAASYDVYEDLLAKSAKGLEFYKKLSGNVQKLLTRCKSACEVQSEERQQRLKSTTSSSISPQAPQSNAPPKSDTPKLRDFLKARTADLGADSVSQATPAASNAIPKVRPVPLGSENPSQYDSSYAYYNTNIPAVLDEPPPPYSLQQPYYDSMTAGYANPLYQHREQNVAPPAYKPVASPNSQLNSLNASMSNITIGSEYDQSQYYQRPQTLANDPNTSGSYGLQQYNLPVQMTYASSNYATPNTFSNTMTTSSADTPQPSIQPMYIQSSQQYVNASANALPPPTNFYGVPQQNVSSELQTPYGLQQTDQSFNNNVQQLSENAAQQQDLPQSGYPFTSTANQPGYFYNSENVSNNVYNTQTVNYDYAGAYVGAPAFNNISANEQSIVAANIQNFEANTLNTTLPPEPEKHQLISQGLSYNSMPQYKYEENALKNAAAPQPSVEGSVQQFPQNQYLENPTYIRSNLPHTQDESADITYQQQSSNAEYLPTTSVNLPAITSLPQTDSTASMKTTGPPTNADKTLSTSQSESTSAATAATAIANARADIINSITNVDLLSDVDFSATDINIPPPLMPQPALASKATSVKEMPESFKVADTTNSKPLGIASHAAPAHEAIQEDLTAKVFLDTSHLSAFQEIDWESELVGPVGSEQHSIKTRVFSRKSVDPFMDNATLNYFEKEVERYEKLVESLNVKTLNGMTLLTLKWKELQSTLEKYPTKRTTTIAKLFPEKNRSLDCLPYDHARVRLERETDDYINAAIIKELGAECPDVIIAQTPQPNTVNDFWSMAWSQKARLLICLHTKTEMFESYWPHGLQWESHFDEITVKCEKIVNKKNITEYQLKLSMHGCNTVLDLSLLQISEWSKGSPSQIIDIAQEVLAVYEDICTRLETYSSPIIINCLTGSERSELMVVAICAISETRRQRPHLINVVDVWAGICAHRQNSLRDTAILERSMHLVLTVGRNILNKHGIITSYQKKAAPQEISKREPECKDPLSDLDPLWKMK